MNKLHMAGASIHKGLQPSAEDLAMINRHTLRELTADEVYAFRVTLCDNQVDRDWERFDVPALHKLAGLFLGRTGVFDHRPSAENQTARIFDTEVVEDTAQESDTAEPYTKLTAKAYMLRDESTAAVIRSIDAGIRKEVSVGCTVDRIVCSVCGSNRRQGGCAHQKGVRYNDTVCHDRLEEPTDAYEWSFVAVPAQPAAGVTKSAAEDHLPPALASAVRALHEAVERLTALLEQSDQASGPPPEVSVAGTEESEKAAALIKSVQTMLGQMKGASV